MGYTTKFTGALLFNQELTASKIVKLKSILGEDCRDHPEWETKSLYRIDLELNDDLTGVRWDGMEKTYDMDKLVNVVITEMRKTWPDFGFMEGSKLSAQGEDVEDRWELVINDKGLAERREVLVIGDIIRCPHCDEKINLAEIGSREKKRQE